jgi:hypothetical protein
MADLSPVGLGPAAVAAHPRGVRRADRGRPPPAADPDRLRTQAARAINSNHRRLRDQTSSVVGGCGPWGPAGPDGSAELLGLPAGLLAAHSGPCRPLWQIAACARAVGDL